MNGRVKAFDEGKGYGFIVGDNGKEYLVHLTAVKGNVQNLRAGSVVEFKPVDTPKGPQAVEVFSVEQT